MTKKTRTQRPKREPESAEKVLARLKKDIEALKQENVEFRAMISCIARALKIVPGIPQPLIGESARANKAVIFEALVEQVLIAAARD